MNLITLLDKDLLIAFLLSLGTYIYKKILIICILNVPNYYLKFINRSIILTNNSILSDSDSESDFSSDSELYTQTENSDNPDQDEYEYILKFFSISSKMLTIFKNNIVQNNNQLNNNIKIIDCFLFNILKNNDDFIIDSNNIYSLKYKIVLIYLLYNKLNTSTIFNLFPEFRYFYILYQTNDNQYNYKLLDLNKNYDIIKNKKVLFNVIKFEF